ncbi:MAG: TMEM175 family protein [Bacteroidota bacterium]|nr:TMEM175 family protein [Bacteroidota bacterium]
MEMETIPDKSKREFQLERMILFSDAVFAIAITLLVIEIKVPHLEEQSDGAVAREMLHLLPKIFGFITSFFVIGIFWTVHHRIFGTVVNYNTKLLWLNLLFLLSIALMPFSTALYSEFYMPQLIVPYIFYTINISLIGFLNFLIVRHINNPKNQLRDEYDEPNAVKASYARALMMPIIFTIGLIIGLLTFPAIGRICPILIPVYLVIVNKWFRPAST